MPVIIGVKFRNIGKVYYFDPGELAIRYHDHVIVETARGIEYGTVVLSPTEIAEDKLTAPLKPVLRLATEEDEKRERENRDKEKEAYQICKKKIMEREMDMKLIAAEYTFDGTKLLFYFAAEGRIDFRDLVKDLAGIFRMRIELRQIGVRDETKILGGIGSCGRPLCCHTWLGEFAPVSIKMAKDQNLSLNPTKISGTCGRLMCCLKNEADTYAWLNKGMPGKGDYVTTPDGLHGDVQSVNILRQTVRVIVDLGNDEKEMQEFNVADITFIPKSKKPKNPQNQQNANQKAENRREKMKGKNGEEPKNQEEEGSRENVELMKKKRRRPKTEGNAPEHAGAAGSAAQQQNAGGQTAAASAEEKHEQPAVQSEKTEGEQQSAGGEQAASSVQKKRRRRRHRKGPKPEGAGDSAPEIGYGSNEGE